MEKNTSSASTRRPSDEPLEPSLLVQMTAAETLWEAANFMHAAMKIAGVRGTGFLAAHHDIHSESDSCISDATSYILHANVLQSSS